MHLEKAKSIIGIELNEEAVEKSGRTAMICMDATSMTFADNTFNVVIAIEVFEHIPELQKTLSVIARVLKPRGKCYISVPFEFFLGQQALGCMA